MRKKGGVIMVEIPNTFILIAAPTQAACEKMETIKGRPKGMKNFGFSIGHLDNFYNLIEKDTLPTSMQTDPNSFGMFEPSHLNVVLTKDKTFNNIIVRDGTVQGYITKDGSPVREFFKQIESGLAGYNEPELLSRKDYSAPLVTSANECHQGSITEWEKAKAFGKEKGIPLVVRFDLISDQDPGSFAVFQLRPEVIRTVRKGIKQNEIKERDEVKKVRSGFAKHILEALDLIGGERSIAGLYEVFKSIDTTDGDGSLDQDELQQFINKVKRDTTNKSSGFFFSFLGFSSKSTGEKDADILFNAIDFNGDGKISFVEFARFLEDAHEGGTSPHMQSFQDKFVLAFRRQVDAILGSTDEALNLDAFIRAFSSIDLNKDNSVSKEELRVFLRSDLYPVSDVELDVLFAFLDADDSEDVSFVEIVRYLEDCVGDLTTFVEKENVDTFNDDHDIVEDRRRDRSCMCWRAFFNRTNY
jgi:Ca2+-binding EF-hand superfamily protein